jgi:trimeric autotransporter adhesin
MKCSNNLQNQNSNQTRKATIKNCRFAIVLVSLLAASQIVHAQWSRTAPNVYLTTGTDKVGIGTTSPQTKLYINDQTSVSSFTGINNAGLRIHAFDNASNNYALFGFSGLSSAYNNRNLAQIGANFTSSGSSLFFGTSSSYSAGITNTAMTINPHGNVGIGTTTPALILDVNGDAVFNGVRVGKGNGGVSTNTAIGNGALDVAGIMGSSNTATGYQTLFSTTVGFNNTATGAAALFSNTTGEENTANGYNALYFNTKGIENIAVGSYVLNSNSVGNFNTATGYAALNGNTSGNSNTVTGSDALFNNTTGSNNVANGYLALQSNKTGSNNIGIGSRADVSSGTLVNATAIGTNATVNGSNKMQLGSSTTVLSTTGGYTIVSDGRFKEDIQTDDAPGLAFINKLHPVAYNFNYQRYDDFLRKDMKKDKPATDEYKQQLVEKSKQRQVGFIAQEVDQMCRDNKFIFNGVYAPQNSNDNYALDYSRFVVPLVKAVQELSSKNDDLSEKNNKLQNEVNQLKAIVYAGSNMNNGTAGITINDASQLPLLGQNIPNPAANNTIIPFRIPKNCNSASIIISEVGSGKIITAIPVSCGETHLAIDAGSLASGSYTYSLYINGKLLDTKQMILAK